MLVQESWRTAEEKTALAIDQLSQREKEAMRRAAANGDAGGEPLTGSLREKAVDSGLAYKSSGRLRPHAYKMLTA